MSTLTEQSETDALRQELAAWRENCRKAEAECAKALEAREVMARRLDASPGMREIVGELRRIAGNLAESGDMSTAGMLGRERLMDLLRRLDRE